MPNTEHKANEGQTVTRAASTQLPGTKIADSSDERILKVEEIAAFRAFFELLAQWDEEVNGNGNRNSR